MNKFLKLKDDEKINVSLADAEAAAAEGVSLSTYLNNKYASIVEKFNGELDAFDIALLSKGIIVKDNLEFRSEEYIDSESFRDNFEGSEEQLKIIAQTTYQCCEEGNDDEFLNRCKSMLNSDYDYLNDNQYNEVMYKWIEELITNNGEFKGE